MEKIISKAAALVCVFAMFTFVSCTKEASDDQSGGEQATIQINITNPEVTKAFDAEDGSTINDVTVLIIARGSIINKYWFANLSELTTANTAKSIITTTVAEHVYIVGNLSSSSTIAGSGLFGDGVKTVAQAEAVKYALAGITKTNVPTFGKTATQLSFSADGDTQKAEAPIQMGLIPARIDVTVNNNMTNYGTTDAIVLQSVGIVFSGKETLLIPNTTTYYELAYTANSNFYASGYLGYPNQTADDHVTTAVTSLVAPWTANSDATWVASPGVASEPANFLSQYTKTFYVIPVDNNKNTIVTVMGKFPVGAVHADETKFYPAHFGTADVGNTQIESGKQYELTINLNGDASDGTGGGGTDTPEIPVTSGYVTINLTPKAWQAVQISTPKEFN